MTDGEIAREYNQAKNKKTEIEVLSDLTLKPKEEIIRILKENGCEVEESRRGRKPKEEETDGNAIKPVRRRKIKSNSEVPDGGSSAGTTNSVVPIMAQKLVETNCSYLKVGERCPNPIIKIENSGQIAFA